VAQGGAKSGSIRVIHQVKQENPPAFTLGQVHKIRKNCGGRFKTVGGWRGKLIVSGGLERNQLLEG